MRRIVLAISAVAMLSLIAPAAFALNTRATMDDAIAMWRSGMTAGEIVTFIEKNGAYGPLSDENIDQMEEAGMPARLIVEVDRSFRRMANADARRYTPAYRSSRPVVYGYPYYSSWRTGIAIGFGHGGFGSGFGHGGRRHRGRH